MSGRAVYVWRLKRWGQDLAGCVSANAVFNLPLPHRLLGSYSQLHYGYLPDALVDLTGGVVTIVNLHSSPSDLLMAVKTAVQAGSMVACATPKGVSKWDFLGTQQVAIHLEVFVCIFSLRWGFQTHIIDEEMRTM